MPKFTWERVTPFFISAWLWNGFIESIAHIGATP
jgi:hypothetical protein